MSNLDTRLALLKTDLGLIRISEEQKTFLEAILTTSASAISREGITLTDGDIECDALVAMYAAWVYRRRAEPGNTSFSVGMPRYLRSQLNNMLMSQKMAVSENDI